MYNNITDIGIDIATYANLSIINSTVNDTTDYGLMLHGGSNVLINYANFINTDWLKFYGDHTNVTVKNCVINDYYHPIISLYSDYSTISNITFNKGAIWIDGFNNGDINNLNKPLGSDDNNGLGSLHLTTSHNNDIHHKGDEEINL